MGKTRPGLPMLTKTKTKEELAAAGFMQQGLAQSIKSMQPEICRTGTVQEKKKLHQDHMMEMALNKRILLAEGKMEYAGYYTDPF